MRPVLTAALAVLLLLGLACQTVEEELAGLATPTPLPNATPTPSLEPGAAPTATVIPVTGWTTFTNTAFGYSIDYPADWLIDPYDRRDETTSDYVDIYNFQPPLVQGPTPPTPLPGALRIEIYVSANDRKLPLNEWVADFNANSVMPTTVLSSTSEEIHGAPAITQAVTVGTGSGWLVTFFDAGHHVIWLNGPSVDSPFLEAFRAMLSSFQLSR